MKISRWAPYMMRPTRQEARRCLPSAWFDFLWTGDLYVLQVNGKVVGEIRPTPELRWMR